MRALFFIATLLTLAACEGHQKGADVGIGFDALNTQSKDDKEEEKWFNSFYGSRHCYGQWAGECKLGESGDSD